MQQMWLIIYSSPANIYRTIYQFVVSLTLYVLSVSLVTSSGARDMMTGGLSSPPSREKTTTTNTPEKKKKKLRS